MMRFTDGYQPRYLANVYYAPDDPHVTNPSQPGYVGSNLGGGGYSSNGGPSNSQDPSTAGMPGGYGGPSGGMEGSSTSPTNVATSYGGGMTVPAGTYSTATGDQALPTDYTVPYSFGNSPYTFTISPSGMQAPVDQMNVDTNPPYTVYPPGTPAPADQTQLNTSQMTGAGAALAAMTLPDQGTYFGTEQDQNKKNQQANNGAFIPGQQYVAQNDRGTYDVVIGGRTIASGLDKEAAQRQYNMSLGLPNGPAGAAAPTAPQNAMNPNDPQVQKMAQDLGISPQDILAAAQRTGKMPNQLTLQDIQAAQQLRGSFDPNAAAKQDAADKAAFNAQRNAQLAADTAAAQQDARNKALPQLVQVLNGAFGPAATNTINALLGQMGLPPLGTSAGPGVMPNGISPAQWDALPDAAKTLILQAWAIRAGGDPQQAAKDFIAQIDSQRPAGKPSTGINVSYAPLAA